MLAGGAIGATAVNGLRVWKMQATQGLQWLLLHSVVRLHDVVEDTPVTFDDTDPSPPSPSASPMPSPMPSHETPKTQP